MPLTVWAFFITAVIGVISFPVLLSAALLLIMYRSFGTSLFLSDIYLAGEVLNYQGGSPALFEHLFWFLGHPEVYIVLLPALGITSEVIATNSRKPIFGYRAMIMSILAIAVFIYHCLGTPYVRADGVHLPARRLAALDTRPALEWVGASFHTRDELERAAALGLDYALLGSVQPTASHPGQHALGWDGFAELRRELSLPVLALGGLQPAHLDIARSHGAHGIAGIRNSWLE